MSEWIASVFLVLGGSLLFLAAVGLLRMPDVFTRMQAATKAGTLGVGLVLAAAGFAFRNAGVTVTVLFAIAFFLLTAPVAAHMIGRAAYRAGVTIWDRTQRDELREETVSNIERG